MFRSQPVAWFGGIENGYRGVHVWPEPDPVDSKLTLLKVSFKQRQHEVQIWENISVKCHSIRKQNCGPKDFLSSLFSLSKIFMHNELWGRAEILANFFVIIVFVNTLHTLTEVFHLLLLRVSKPQGFIALPFALDSLCNIILSFNAKSVVIFIVKVKNRAAGKKKNEYEMILFLLNVLLTNTII